MAEPVGSRKQQAEERRTQILDASARVFGAKGVDKATMRDIAREAGITEGLIYHYFESKDDLVHACWRERSWRANQERILRDMAGATVAEVLHALVTDFLATLYDCGPTARLHTAIMCTDSDMAAAGAEHIQANIDAFGAFLSARAGSGEIVCDVDPQAAGGLLMGSAYSFFIIWGRISPTAWAERASRFATNTVTIIMNGIVNHALPDAP